MTRKCNFSRFPESTWKDRMLIHDVEVTPIQLDVGQELTDSFYRNCVFCEKLIKITPLNFKSLTNIGNGEYCPFCLRHEFHHRDSHNILAFSFRGILGYYYYRLYRTRVPKIYESQIENIIEKQALIGLQSPVLSFDPGTFLWFADFNMIGTDKHKAPYEEIETIIRRMYNELGLFTYWAASTEAVWDKFQKAIHTFYQKRKRPKDRRMLIPTLYDLMRNEDEDFWDQTRDFNRTCLVIK